MTLRDTFVHQLQARAALLRRGQLDCLDAVFAFIANARGGDKAFCLEFTGAGKVFSYLVFSSNQWHT